MELLFLCLVQPPIVRLALFIAEKGSTGGHLNKVFIFKYFEGTLRELTAHVVVKFTVTAKPAIVAGLWRPGWQP
ncbi:MULTISPECIES: hypothetical protein [Roseovarius]|uniref:hypothetical protein n=1 Tax=Roseovarius TaxID=74030 RepID=UPI0011AEDFF9|nr:MULTISPECIES: hypothetical protein [Roseovarius]